MSCRAAWLQNGPENLSLDTDGVTAVQRQSLRATTTCIYVKVPQIFTSGLVLCLESPLEGLTCKQLCILDFHILHVDQFILESQDQKNETNGSGMSPQSTKPAAKVRQWSSKSPRWRFGSLLSVLRAQPYCLQVVLPWTSRGHGSAGFYTSWRPRYVEGMQTIGRICKLISCGSGNCWHLVKNSAGICILLILSYFCKFEQWKRPEGRIKPSSCPWLSIHSVGIDPK